MNLGKEEERERTGGREALVEEGREGCVSEKGRVRMGKLSEGSKLCLPVAVSACIHSVGMGVGARVV